MPEKTIDGKRGSKMDDFIRVRYDLSMERISRFPEESEVKAPYQDYFKTVASFIGLCDEVLTAKLSGEMKNWSEEYHAEINH